jgi:hypothetical protein
MFVLRRFKNLQCPHLPRSTFHRRLRRPRGHMGWTETARREHDRSGLRYASDCTDEEWAVVRPLLRRTSKVGRPRKHKARTLWDAIQYIASTGCQWAHLPKIFRLSRRCSIIPIGCATTACSVSSTRCWWHGCGYRKIASQRQWQASLIASE